VRKLPADLQAIGKEAAGEFAAKFEELTESVDAKGKDLVQTLATKYNEALKAVDDEIAAEKEKNKGLVAKAVDAVKGAIDTILKLKDMLMGVLAKAAQAVMAIIKDPIGFLGNLVSAVGAGLKQFMANIGAHLKKGLIGWLLGAMAGAGLELPAKFDLRGIITMVASMLGLTWDAIRARVVQRGVPEQAMGAVEQSVPVAQKLQSQGVAGVTDEIAQQVGDLKGGLLSKISEYLIPTVLIAGITWIVSLLNPASAFIRACKMIIDFVTFVVTQGAQIIQFVNAVLDAVIAIAGGGAGGVPGLIENALSRSVPVLIGVLAALLGIGGIAGKIQSFFRNLAKPITKAVNWIVDKIVGFGKKIWAKLKNRFDKGKNGKTNKDRETRQSRDVKAEARRLLKKATAKPFEEVGDLNRTLERILARLRPKGLKSLTAKPGPQETGSYEIEATASPGSNAGRAVVVSDESLRQVVTKHGQVLAQEVKRSWWKNQLKETGAWRGIDVLNNYEDQALSYLHKNSTIKSLRGFFDPGQNGGIKRSNPDTDVFRKHALHDLQPNPAHSVRVTYYGKLGEAAETALKTNAKQEVIDNPTLNGKLEKINFQSDNQFGRFSSLPVEDREVDPQLKEAAGKGRILAFLRELAEKRESGGVTRGRLKELWNEEGPGQNPHRKFLKDEFRRIDADKHEWIPTNMIIDVLETQISLGAPPNSISWIDLQHELRSFTTSVIWEVRPDPSKPGIDKYDMDAHVGAFQDYDGNPIYNGRDHQWHKNLRDYFTSYRSSDGASPVGFVIYLRDLLQSGKLMWNGDTGSFKSSQLSLPVKAIYKSIKALATRTEEEQRETPLTLEDLAEHQQDAYAEVLGLFNRVIANLSESGRS